MIVDMLQFKKFCIVSEPRPNLTIQITKRFWKSSNTIFIW